MEKNYFLRFPLPLPHSPPLAFIRQAFRVVFLSLTVSHAPVLSSSFFSFSAAGLV